MTRHNVLPLVVAAAASFSAFADVSLPSVVSSGMVLQRETDASVFGFARPGEVVTVSPSWAEKGAPAVTVSAAADGMWSAVLSTRGVGPGPHTIEVRGDNAITLRDVLVGEVWLCSGQSNMEWPLGQSKDGAKFVAEANDPMLRVFTVPNTTSLHNRIDTPGAGGWAGATPQSVAGFSAVGYQFAKEVRAKLGVPVGVISADWGGTRVEAWMSDTALAKQPSVADELAREMKAKDPLTRDTDTSSLDRKWWASFDRAGKPAIGGGWRGETYDDAAWAVAKLPGAFAGDLAAFDGVVYYRRKVTLAAGVAAGAKDKVSQLSLGPIDDRDEAYVNGVLVGATYDDGLWNKDRVYDVPAGVLHEGENTIAVAVLDTAGPGGIFGDAAKMTLAVPGNAALPLAGDWKSRKGPAMGELPEMPRSVEVTPNSAGVLYRGMIAPLTRMSVGGVIWYQGESNRSNGAEYGTLFPAMIEDWRAQFGHADMPFYFVQIAPYTYGGDIGQTAMLREAQSKALTLEHTGMVVTMDVGEPADIHPRDKETVGKRLAWLALADFADKTGAGAEASGVNYPTFLRMRGLESGTLLVDFNIRPGELVAKGDELTGFEIAGADRRFFPARAVIRGNWVEVSHPRVPAPVAVRYGFCNDCQPTLFSREGLPAAPFRSDTWAIGEWSTDQEDAIAKLRDPDPVFHGLVGADLSGWTNVNTFGSTWSVGKDEYGAPMIHCTGSPTGVLRTNVMYENFVLELEWRHLVPKANSGLFIWSDAVTARGQPFTRAIEVQVMDGMEDTWYTSDGDVFPIHGATMTPLTRPSGSRAMPLEKRANPSPMWNHYRVECINGELSLAVNGKVVSRGKDISPRKGYICLESEGGTVDFRNIRIKELPAASPALTAEQVAWADEGFVPLLSDAELSQWDMTDAHKGHWKMDDWVLAFDGKAPHLKTKKEYGDYELICDWRFPQTPREDAVPVILPDGSQKLGVDGKGVTETVKNGGDSGIYLRGTERSQVNIWCWPVGSGELWDVRNDKGVAPEVRAGATPKAKADRPVGEWNRFRIKVVGERVTVDLNGTRVIDNALVPGINAKGPILLQNHTEPMEFANVYVRELGGK